ncbi:helicase Cas3 [Methylophaga lonarensis MPL]|uniref:Helicase Cas3 n=1 Tax=Methylophaga lonarensis MPL TaxID=1286106 RepID=M7PF34_9GAMM|nr:CRISPR-associated helicase/endonuclease Cas3 [Methylophaga lonarensis]EMR12515.1 helicase Cas3 [Methylophaga lonarensis MPL]
MTEIPSYFRYWGKARKDPEQSGPDFHLLPYHCLDVAAVADMWWTQSSAIKNAFIQLSGLDETRIKAWVLFFVALHDYGKWDLRFQRKAPMVWDAVNPDLAVFDLPLSEHEIKTYFHGPEGLAWFYRDNENRFSTSDWMDKGSEDWTHWCGWLAAVAGHHGHIPKSQPDEAGLPIRCQDAEPLLKAARLAWLEELETLYLQPAGLSLADNPPELDERSQIMLAGFCSVCDWLGSSDFFPYVSEYPKPQKTLKDWYEHRFKYAEKSLIAAGVLSHTQPKPSIEKLLGAGQLPRQIQCLVDDLPLTQSLTLIEASTGSGKTEAALAYAWKLLNQGLADSIVFALPTQATANAMFARLERAAETIFRQETNLVLAHGKARYQELFKSMKQIGKRQILQGKEEAWVQCGEWLAQSRKRVFLGQIGVCTVDQVLVSVLPVKHKFVRGFGIGRSVLIVDEVHAYDSYMYGLLTGVLQQQRASGGSAVLLSATLPAHQKQALADAWQCQLDETVNHYPLITHCQQNQVKTFDLEHLPEPQPEKQFVSIELIKDESLLPNEELLRRIMEAVSKGAQVCLVCNLVDVAQKIYRILSERMDEYPGINQDQISLFHSRFTFTDRQQKEQSVLDTFGVKPKPENARDKGHVLIATQVVEQSLDVDFDWLLTQLCPVDLLFQRMGRLHRHSRKRPIGFEQRLCTILVPDSLDYQLHELIYGNSRVLWRTHQLLEKTVQQGGQIEFPTAYRAWIEPVYQEDEWNDEPEIVKASYEKFSENAFASKCNAKALMNSGMNPLNDDDAKVSLLTRDGEMSLSLVPYVVSTDGNRCLLNGQAVDEMEEAERFEAINLNTIPVPHSWGRKSGQLPEPDSNGLIWLEMQKQHRGYCGEFGIWQYSYSSQNGFQRVDNAPKEMK